MKKKLIKMVKEYYNEYEATNSGIKLAKMMGGFDKEYFIENIARLNELESFIVDLVVLITGETHLYNIDDIKSYCKHLGI